MSLTTLTRRAVLMALGLMALSFGVFALFQHQTTPVEPSTTTPQKAQAAVEELASQILEPVLESHGIRWGELLQRLSLPPGTARVEVIRGDGTLLAAFNPRGTVIPEGLTLRGEAWIAVEGALRTPKPCLECHLGDDVGSGRVRLMVEDPPVPVMSPLVWWAIQILLMLGVGVCAALVVLHLFIRRPLEHLVDQMGRVAEGDFSVRIQGPYPKEVARLVEHFNAMVADLQLLQQEVRQAHFKQMERMDRLASVGEMAAGIAHEIRNPLAGISGAITVMADDLPSDDARQPILREVLQQIRRLDKTVTDLLYYARPGDPEFTKCDINELISKTLFFVSQHPEARNVHRTEELTRDLPAVEVDSTQVQQILLNLLLNAIQAMPKGGTLRVGTEQAEGHIRVAISDSGSGIPEEEREKIFTPFFTTKARGTGLGLSICRRLVEQQGGAIEVQDTPGGGTTMVLSLPLEPTLSEEKDNS